ncbi:hybrid sensor histidine kinase/response regulator [Idiomarina tyrosinivorans]|uniref:histidine kinase n=1 Tax=Idiomarina tyrosinivorans TaxID=1445662 RepID=A0A432ZQQ8_9GAMM|nr:PAS-domain containing protein [Idiomarina tyrosinivorans]RUO80239.1 hybrid sensor histidine kinase/response regulator [Idiomarina tyrosinivorans]
MSWLLVFAALAYIAFLFTVASYGDKVGSWANRISYRPFVYAMSLAIYCTSWTYYGAVGNAAVDGWAYLPILLGPALLFLFGLPVMKKLVSVSKQQNITSIADFISSRFGKRRRLAVFVTLIATLATVPYIALQLKAVGNSFAVLTESSGVLNTFSINEFGAAAIMAVFAMLFGTRHVEVTEYRSGMILAIAVESMIKLGALLLAAIVAWWLLAEHNAAAVWEHLRDAQTQQWSLASFSEFDFIVQTFMAAGAILCLPRQFHVAVVDNVDVKHLNTARWGFPLYLALTALAIIPIALAGNYFFASPSDGSTFALRLPLIAEQTWLSVLIFIGGISAATAMVIIASVTLSTMITNDVIMPVLLQRESRRPMHERRREYGKALLLLRRLAIALIMLLAFACYYFWAARTNLVSIGLLAFSLVLQLLPAIIGALYWRHGHARGVYAGLTAGLVSWVLSVLVPLYLPHPEQTLSDTSIITQGTVISIIANALVFVLVSMMAKTRLVDRIQATAFVKPRAAREELAHSRHHKVTVADMMLLLRTFLGSERAQQIMQYYNARDDESLLSEAVASKGLIHYVERAIAGVLGAATARSLIQAALRDKQLNLEEVVHFFDDTTQALQTQQSILFSSLENLAQGISVVDADLRLVAWNRRYLDLFDYPEGMVQPGQPIATLIRYNAERGECGPGEIDELVSKRLRYMQMGSPHRFIRRRGDGRVIEMVGNPLPRGGFVTSFTDITEHVETQQALEEANIDLEHRIDVRSQKIREINNELTEEIERRRQVEQQLQKAKAEAEAANASKTRFLALASHDILQPLNAARLYLSAVDEQQAGAANQQLLAKLDTALGSTEHLLSTLLSIAKMEQGAQQPKFRHVSLNSILQPLIQEYSVLAEQRSLRFSVHYQDAAVYTDPTYLRRIVQNFLSNAIKYTPQGKVLLGVRKRAGQLQIGVWDTGPGIPEQQRAKIFDAFYRIKDQAVDGVGLGLSVAQRMSEQLNCKLRVDSIEGRGSCFSVSVPLGSAALVKAARQASADDSLVSPLTMVCVDDNPENLSAMSALLSKWQCRAITFQRASDVLAYAKQHPAPDGLLIDYQLGQQLDGIALTAELRKLWGSTLPAALVTAMQEDAVKRAARQASMHFLTKPLKPAALKSLLKYISSKRN